MNENNTIYRFLATKGIDYVNCPIAILLEAIEEYFQIIEEEKFFSDQMLILYKNVEEKRGGIDAIRLNMKSLDLISPKPVGEAIKPTLKPDI